jgi:hypothetical protein
MPVIQGQATGKHFFLVEKPGLNVVVMAGTQEEALGEEEGVDRAPDIVY